MINISSLNTLKDPNGYSRSGRRCYLECSTSNMLKTELCIFAVPALLGPECCKARQNILFKEYR